MKPMTIATLIVAIAAVALRAWGLEVYFLRHGETTWNRAKVLQGSVPYTDLTKKGVRMAEETAKGMVSAGIRFDSPCLITERSVVDVSCVPNPANPR